MTNRKILYGYQIQNGELTTVPAEAAVVGRVFALYAGGLSYQKISDTLNGDGIPFSGETPLWNKHKVKRLLENPRYTGRDGYPPLVEPEDFRAVQALIQDKTAGYTQREVRPAERLKPFLRCGSCGEPLARFGRRGCRNDTLYLKCGGCGAHIAIPDADLLSGAFRQLAEYDSPQAEPYAPSEQVVQLANAINRGLEHPEKPDEGVSLILQGVSARYDCCPATITSYQITDRPAEADWKRFGQAVSHIMISTENAVTVYFK